MPTISVARSASLSCPQAIAEQLRHALPAAWTLAQQHDTFVVRGAMNDGWQSEIGRVTRFVASNTFVSLEQVERGSHHVEQLIVSIDSEGAGYRIRYLLCDSPDGPGDEER